MAKEILLYQPLYSYTVADFITQMEANKSNDICGRVNCPGGDVYAAYGALAKWNEHPMGKLMKIDGRADSMAAYMMCNADNVECLDVSKFVFHRASMPSYIENDKARFTDALKAELTAVNTDLRKLIEDKITAKKWKAITGVSLDDLFSLDSRIDLEINAEQAQKLGLVQKIVPLSKGKQIEINAFCSSIGIAAAYNISNDNEKKPIMTALEYKAAHPKEYAEILAEGVTQERERVEAYLEFADVDLKAAKEGIAAGKEPTAKFFAQMARKEMSTEGKANVVAASAVAIVTPEVTTTPTAEEKANAEFSKNLSAMALNHLGIEAVKA